MNEETPTSVTRNNMISRMFLLPFDCFISWTQSAETHRSHNCVFWLSDDGTEKTSTICNVTWFSLQKAKQRRRALKLGILDTSGQWFSTVGSGAKNGLRNIFNRNKLLKKSIYFQYLATKPWVWSNDCYRAALTYCFNFYSSFKAFMIQFFCHLSSQKALFSLVLSFIRTIACLSYVTVVPDAIAVKNYWPTWKTARIFTVSSNLLKEFVTHHILTCI